MAYTREQILKMPASRELEAMVSHYVMGWIITAGGCYRGKPELGYDVEIVREPGVGEHSLDIPKGYSLSFHSCTIRTKDHFALNDLRFTTRIEHAWRALQKQATSLGEHGHGRKGYRLDTVIDVARIVPLAQCQIGRVKATAEEDEMPLAICRAALISALSL